MSQSVHNIIVLGESGVGKSTLINSMANYTKYGTYKEAFDGEPIRVINKETESVEKVGSKTSCPCLYAFSSHKGIIHILDTPGANDSKGTDLDGQNIEAIFDALAKMLELHAICILVEAETSRLNDNIKQLLNTLLKNFHESARDNIVFCYTKVSSFDDLQDGDYPPATEVLSEYFKVTRLTVQMSEQNQFYFNNFGFENLISKKHKPNADREKGWKHSASETKRFIDYVTRLTPHSLEKTTSINKTIQRIKILINPVCVVFENIGENIAIEEGSLKTISVPLDEPKIICKKCIEFEEIKLANGKTMKCPVFKKCQKADMSLFRVAVSLFWGYNLISSHTSCSTCKCIAKLHEVSCYDILKTYSNEKIDKSSLETEGNTILDTCARFSQFLRINSLSRKDDRHDIDVFVEKFSEIIDKEKFGYLSGDRVKKLNSLQTMFNTYIRVSHRRRTEDCVHLRSLDDLFEMLYQLPFTGAIIKDLMEQQERSRRIMFNLIPFKQLFSLF